MTDTAFFADAMFCTENCKIYTSGCETSRENKIHLLYYYAPSYFWLHPCIFGVLGDKNCGTCLKCLCMGLTLYADNAFEKYASIFDAQAFLQDLDSHVVHIYRADRHPDYINDTITYFMKKKKDDFLRISTKLIRKQMQTKSRSKTNAF